EPGGGVAGDFGGLGGVLGQVGRDHGVGDVPGRGDGDNAYVNLLAPTDQPAFGFGRVRVGGEADGAGGVLDRVGQLSRVQASGWGQDRRLVVPVVAVEADDEVQVDHGASLEFGRLAVGQLQGIGRVSECDRSALQEPFDGDA